MDDVHAQLVSLDNRVEQLIDNHQMFMDGVQLVVNGQTKADSRIDGLVRDQAAVIKDIAALKTSVDTAASAFTAAVDGFSKEMRWMRATVFFVLLAVVVVAGMTTKPAKAPLSMVSK